MSINPQLEQSVQEACENFQTFVLAQMVVAWFADAPDPEALIDEVMIQWRERLTRLYDARVKAHFDQTGIVVANPIEEIANEAEKRLRAMLNRRMGEQSPEPELTVPQQIGAEPKVH